MRNKTILFTRCFKIPRWKLDRFLNSLVRNYQPQDFEIGVKNIFASEGQSVIESYYDVVIECSSYVYTGLGGLHLEKDISDFVKTLWRPANETAENKP